MDETADRDVNLSVIRDRSAGPGAEVWVMTDGGSVLLGLGPNRSRPIVAMGRDAARAVAWALLRWAALAEAAAPDGSGH